LKGKIMGIQERKERERENRKNQIMEAAEKIFFSKGLQNTTMDEIAKECELSKGTLYLYYKSKEELYSQIVLKILNLLYTMMIEGVSKFESIPDRLQGLGEAYLEFSKKYPQYFLMVNSLDDDVSHKEICDLSDSTKSEIFKLSGKIWSLDVGLIKEGMEQGIFKKDIDPYEIALILWSSSNGIINIINHFRKYKHAPKDLEDSPFSKLNCEDTLYHLWEMIYVSIMVENGKKTGVIQKMKMKK
jgi:AcrR family transcriptional regulator